MNQSKSCLIVEDSPTQAASLQSMLERHGYAVRVAENGLQALKVLKEFRPSVIVSDIVMPEMDGLELCRRLKSDPKSRDISVMLFTGLSEPDDVFRALECGADNFVTKPADEQQILRRLDYLIANQRVREDEALHAGIEVNFRGNRQFITSSRLQILNLLLSSYDVAVRKNQELEAATEALREANETLEVKVAERTAHLEEEIAQRQAAEIKIAKQARLGKLVEAAASAANQGRNSREIIREIIDNTCQIADWPLGHYYHLRNDGVRELVAGEYWFCRDSGAFAPLIDATMKRSFRPGEGVVGTAFETGRAVWIQDALKDATFVRGKAAVACGIKTALAVPVAIESRIVGVLEFFHTESLEIDDELQSAIIQEGHHLARMLERESAARALADRERFLQSILDHTTAVIFVKDTDGKYLTVNQSFEKLVGLRREEIVGKTDFEILPHKLAQLITQHDREVIDSRTPKEFEELLGENGATRTYISLKFPLRDKRDEIYAIGGHLTDITERKRAEENRRLMTEAIDQSLSGIAIVSLAGEVVLTNRTLVEMSGRSAKELRFISDLDLGRTESEGLTLEQLWHRLRGERRKRVETTFSRFGSSSERVWNVRVTKLKNREDDASHYLFTMHDITSERALERQIQRKHRLESIGTLAGGIAHDFNNILSAVLGYSELAMANLDEKEQLREDLARIHSAGQRARVLIQQILRFSRSEGGNRVRVDIRQVAEEVLKLAEAGVPKTITLACHVDENCQHVLADAAQLEQVLLNIVTNAAHAIGEAPGRIEVRTTPFVIEPGDEYIHPDLRVGEYARIAVTDNGCGMSQRTMDRIFDPFFTTKGAAEGTGLGLSNSHAIIREHEGAITVYSEEGVGTEFHIYLPVAKRETESETPAVESRDALGGVEHILAVDDVETLVLLTKRRLEAAGYQVTTAASPQKVIELIRAEPEKFDMLISDSAMPGMSGEQLAEKIQEINPKIPVLIVSGYSAKASTEPLPSNVKGFLAKPLPQGQLLSAVRQILEGHSVSA